jgi:hypothetical protein
MYARELWAKRSKDAAVLLTKAAVAKLEIIAACGVRRSIWSMKFMRAVLKLQASDACHMPCITRHTSHVTRHTSHVTRHTSHVTRHTSHVTRTGMLQRLARAQ